MANSKDDADATAPAPKASNPPQQQPKKEKKIFPRPKNKVDRSKLPQPTHITQSETALTNDPLWKDSFILDGETGVMNEDAAKEFETDAAGFVHLVDLEYKAIADVDKAYSKAISPSLHAYFHSIVYWYKIALIAQRHGTASMDQERLIHFIRGYGGLKIAAGAAEYLEGLGDFTDATGIKHVLSVPEPNMQGHFGQATAATHSNYEMLPAPAIFLARVLEDLQNTTERVNNPGWIPQEIRPVARRGPTPPPPPPEQQPRPRRRRADDLAPEGRDLDLRASEEDIVQEPQEEEVKYRRSFEIKARGRKAVIATAYIRRSIRHS